jgi:hypothetical protein
VFVRPGTATWRPVAKCKADPKFRQDEEWNQPRTQTRLFKPGQLVCHAIDEELIVTNSRGYRRSGSKDCIPVWMLAHVRLGELLPVKKFAQVIELH